MLSEIKMPSLLKPQRKTHSHSHTLISQIVGPEENIQSGVLTQEKKSSYRHSEVTYTSGKPEQLKHFCQC